MASNSFGENKWLTAQLIALCTKLLLNNCDIQKDYIDNNLPLLIWSLGNTYAYYQGRPVLISTMLSYGHKSHLLI